VNWYTYAANNPLRFVDPTGKTYEDFEKEAKSRIEQHNQNAIIFSALKGSTFESAVETNISYRDHLAQSAGGTEVAKAQAALKMAGYDLGSYGTQGDGIDGVKGGKTTKAIRHFQHAVGLEPTGNLDPKTIAALDLAVQAGFTKVQLVELGKVLGHGGLVRVNMPLPKDSKRYKEFTPFLDASVAYKFNAFVEDCQKAGIPLVVSEGFRTFAYQEFLYNTDPDAAKPGTSPHESGLAFDLDWKPLTKGQQAALLDIAKAHGFLQTVMPREPWHFGIKADWNYYQFKREYNSQDWLENSKYLTNRGDKYNE